MIYSPLEQFEVTPLISATILFVHLPFTNLRLYALLGFGLTVVPFFTLNNLIPNRFSLGVEATYATLKTLVTEQLGSNRTGYLPICYSLFFLILSTNLLGNVPYGFAIGTSLRVSMGLSLTIWIGVTILALSIHKTHFFSFFVPAGTPLALVPLLSIIELISYIARAISLGVRLMANLVAGHALMKIIAGFMYKGMSSFVATVVMMIPMGLFAALVGLEIAVSLIQAFVFTILTAIYLKEAIELH